MKIFNPKVVMLAVLLMLFSGNIAESAEIYTYYKSGRIKTKEYDIALKGIKKYLYFDEAFYFFGTSREMGRIKRIYREDGSFLVYKRYWDGTDTPKTVKEYTAEKQLVTTYSYYISGRLKIKKFASPSDGALRYLYYDESFYSAGGTEYGRVKRIDLEDGSFSIYEYWDNMEQAKRIRHGKKGVGVQEIYTYYQSGNLESKRYKTPDASGNIYYYYYDEKFTGYGYGRIAIQASIEADSDGAKGIEYEYFDGTETIKYKRGYKTAKYSNPSSPKLKGLAVVYSYYENSGNLESKTLVEADGSGNIYYNYMDEDFDSRGYGRLAGQVLAEPDGDGALGYIYEYFDGTEILKKKYLYGSADYTDPSSPVFLEPILTYEYNENGEITAKVWTEYYDSGRLRMKKINETGSVKDISYFYTDEDWKDTDQGRLEKTLLESSGSGGGGPEGIGNVYLYHALPGTEDAVIGNWYVNMSDNGNIVWDLDEEEDSEIMYYRNSDGVLEKLSDNDYDDKYSMISEDGDVVWVGDLGDGYEINYYNSSSGLGKVTLFTSHDQSITGMSAWHLDNWTPRVSPNGRYVTWVDYRQGNSGGDVYLYDTLTGEEWASSPENWASSGGKIYRRPQVDNFGNLIWQDNSGYAGVIWAKGLLDDEPVNISEPGNMKGWDPQMSYGYAAWQSNGDIMLYDYSTGQRKNIGTAGVHDWDPMINARGDTVYVAWKGGPLWDGTDMYMYNGTTDTVKQLIDDDTQDANFEINENGYIVWQKHFSETIRSLYFFDENTMDFGILVEDDNYSADHIPMTAYRQSFHANDNGDVLWYSDGKLYIQYRADGDIVLLSDDFSDDTGTFARNDFGDIAWRGDTGMFVSRNYSSEKYAGTNNLKRLKHADGEVIEYYADPVDRTALRYNPSDKTYTVYEWDDASGIVTASLYNGIYTASFGEDMLSGVDINELVSETDYHTSGDTNPLDGIDVWDFIEKREYFRDETGLLVRERIYYGGNDLGRVEEYLLTGETTTNPAKIILPVTSNSKTHEIYTAAYGTGSGTTITIRYYEDGRNYEEAFGLFELGISGEHVYIKDEYAGASFVSRKIYISANDLDAETDIIWDSYIPIPSDGAPVPSEQVYEIDVVKYSMYNVDPQIDHAKPLRESETYPFTYYDSGRVRTRFEHSTGYGGGFDRHSDAAAAAFIKAEESTGKIYVYADEHFYDEISIKEFISDIIYLAPHINDGYDMGPLKTYLADKIDNGTYTEYTSLTEVRDDIKSRFPAEAEEALLSMRMIRPYEEHGRLIKEINPDGTYKVFEYMNSSSESIKETRLYNVKGDLLEKRIALQDSQEFMKMGNLPWIRYGTGIGYGDGWDSGYAREYRPDVWELLTGYEEVRASMKRWEGTPENPGYVRLFLFGDLRSGIDFDVNGVPIGFTGGTGKAIADFGVLLEAAGELNIKIMPTLFDYRLAYDERGVVRPDIIEDKTLYGPENKTKAEYLSDLMAELVGAYSTHSGIYAWDIINEPEQGTSTQNQDSTVSMEEMNEFVRLMIGSIREENPSVKLTVGSLTKGYMVDNWIVPDNAMAPGDLRYLDIYQFHYYDSSKRYHDNDHENLDFNESELTKLSSYSDAYKYFYAPNYLGGKPVIGGEIDPTYVTAKLDTMANHGYSGLLFWDDKGNILDPNERREVIDNFQGTVYTYYPGGDIESVRGLAVGEDDAVYIHYDISGRKDKEVLARADGYGTKGFTYEYHADTDVIKKKTGYHSVDLSIPSDQVLSDRTVTYEYDEQGTLQNTVYRSAYYTDTWYKKYEILDEKDHNNVLFKYTINESYYHDDHRGWDGREKIEVKSWQENDSDKWAFDYYYAGGSNNVMGVWVYNEWNSKTIDYSDPEKINFGNFHQFEVWNGYNVDITYYSSTRVESVAYPESDHEGNVYYLYKDEDFNGTGHGRIQETRLGSKNEKGELTFFSQYTGTSDKERVVSSYSTISAGIQDKVAEYTYDAMGRIETVKIFSGPNSLGEAAFLYEYHTGDYSRQASKVTSYATTDMNPGDIVAEYQYNIYGELEGLLEDMIMNSMNAGDPEEESGGIKGVYVDEVLSKNGAIQQNNQEFTGNNITGDLLPVEMQ